VPKIVDPDHRRADLAAAAARLIATVGVERVRLKDVAAAAGWTTGALTHYFPDKRALVRMAMTTSLDQLQGRKELEVAEQADELRWLLERALPLDEERVQHCRVSQAFQVESWDDPELTEIALRSFRRWRRRIATLFAEGQSSGRFRRDVDTETFADEITAMVNGIADHALRDPERWPADKQLAFLERQLAPVLQPDPAGVPSA